jgi:hypothetical protein
MSANGRSAMKASPQTAPDAQAVRVAMAGLDGDPDLHGARFLWARAVGSWAESAWEAGDDVDVRAIYALPTRDYLGLVSYWDEIELVRVQAYDPGQAWELDLVGFDVAKAARLVLKGHGPTLAWLSNPAAPLLSSPMGERLADLARERAAELDGCPAGAVPPKAAAALYEALDALVREARLLAA